MRLILPPIFNKLAKQLCTLSLLVSSLQSANAFAQQEISTTIKSNGTAGEITVSSAETTRAVFVTTLKSNLSQYVDLSATGPSGIKGWAEIRQIKNGGKLGPVFRIEFPKKKKGTTTILVDGSAKALTVSGAPRTLAGEGDPSQEQIDRIASKTLLSKETIKYLLRFMTEEEILAKYGRTTPSNPSNPSNPGGNDPTPKTQPGSLIGRGMVSKDSCDKSVSGYQLSFVIDLSGVNRSTVGNSFKVSASVNGLDSQASAASIKPVSDGKFAPKPLVLIAGVGYSYGSSGQALRLVKWSKGRPGKGKTLKIADTIYYRGQGLARAVADGVLTGGKGTFEIYNGAKVGVACFNLVRARQRVNGYKGGD